MRKRQEDEELLLRNLLQQQQQQREEFDRLRVATSSRDSDRSDRSSSRGSSRHKKKSRQKKKSDDDGGTPDVGFVIPTESSIPKSTKKSRKSKDKDKLSSNAFVVPTSPDNGFVVPATPTEAYMNCFDDLPSTHTPSYLDKQQRDIFFGDNEMDKWQDLFMSQTPNSRGEIPRTPHSTRSLDSGISPVRTPRFAGMHDMSILRTPSSRGEALRASTFSGPSSKNLLQQTFFGTLDSMNSSTTPKARSSCFAALPTTPKTPLTGRSDQQQPFFSASRGRGKLGEYQDTSQRPSTPVQHVDPSVRPRSMSFSETVHRVVLLQRVVRAWAYRRRTHRTSLNPELLETAWEEPSHDHHEKIGKAVVKLQSVGRMLWAAKRVSRMREQRSMSLPPDDEVHQHAAMVIESRYRQHLAEKRMKKILEQNEHKRAIQVIQVVMRTFLNLRRKRREEERREMEEIHNLAALMIQRLWRGHHVRCIMWYDIQYAKRRLLEMKLSKRDRSALIIQCSYRSYKARMLHKRLRQEWMTRKRREEEERRIQLEIEAIHERLTRAEKINILPWIVKVIVAVQRAKRNVALHKQRVGEQLALEASTTIQRYVRGHLTRIWFFNNYRQLVIDREERKFCIECTGKTRNLATRLCHTCRDRYCESCWNKFHAHGNKRFHTYKGLIEGGEYVEDNVQEFGGRIPGIVVKPPVTDWVEYWDDSAQATYYYNLRTGEASWTTPEELEQGWEGAMPAAAGMGGPGGGNEHPMPGGGSYSSYTSYYD